MYDRQVQGRTLTFIFVPSLFKENLLIADEETGSVWSQLGARAITGPLRGTPLPLFPSLQTTWARWKAAHPHTLVLSNALGSITPYRYPDGGLGQGFRDALDLRPYELVLGVQLGEVSRAYPFSELAKGENPLFDAVGEQRITVHYDRDSRAASAYDAKGTLLPTVTVFWRSWRAFHPSTQVYLTPHGQRLVL